MILRLPSLRWVWIMLRRVRVVGTVVVVHVCLRVDRRLRWWMVVGMVVLLAPRLRVHRDGGRDVLARPGRHVLVHHAGGGAAPAAQTAVACLDHTGRLWSLRVTRCCLCLAFYPHRGYWTRCWWTVSRAASVVGGSYRLVGNLSGAVSDHFEGHYSAAKRLLSDVMHNDV